MEGGRHGRSLARLSITNVLVIPCIQSDNYMTQLLFISIVRAAQFVILVFIKMAMNHNRRFHDSPLCSAAASELRVDIRVITCSRPYVQEKANQYVYVIWHGHSLELFPPYWLSIVCKGYHQLNPCRIARWSSRAKAFILACRVSIGSATRATGRRSEITNVHSISSGIDNLGSICTYTQP